MREVIVWIPFCFVIWIALGYVQTSPACEGQMFFWGMGTLWFAQVLRDVTRFLLGLPLARTEAP